MPQREFEITMQTVQDFMQLYLCERVAEEKRQQLSHAPFRSRFHTDDCVWSSQVGKLEMLQSEKVDSISSSDVKAAVITTRCLPDIGEYNLRYHLQPRDESWIICGVDVKCCACGGEPGNTKCLSCHGTGWKDTNLLKARPASSNLKPEAKEAAP